MSFDPYATWLGISPEGQPPTHYDLLGLDPFESDPTKIDQAALRRIGKVRQYQIGPHGDLSQEVLSKLARARLVLIDPDRRADYDGDLRARAGQPVAPTLPAPRPAPLKEMPESGGPRVEISTPREPEALTSLNLDDGGGLRPPSRGAPRWLLPVWQVKVIRMAVYAAAHVLVIGGLLYATGAWKKLFPRRAEPAQALEAKADPIPPARPSVEGGLALAPEAKPKVARSDARPAPKSGAPGPRRADLPRAAEALPVEEIVEPEPVEKPADAEAKPAKKAKAVAPKRAGSPAEETLQEKGLKRSGNFYLLEGEGAVFTKLEEVRKAYGEFEAARQVCAGNENHLAAIIDANTDIAAKRAEIQNLQERVAYADQMAGARKSNTMIRDSRQMALDQQAVYRTAISALNVKLTGLNNTRPNQQQIDAAIANRDRSLIALREAASEMRAAADSVADDYRKLKADGTAKDAIAALGKNASTVKIGPSDKFTKAVSELAKCEKTFGMNASSRVKRK